MNKVRAAQFTKFSATKAERELLRHMCPPWWNIINKRSFYVTFGTEAGRSWIPRGPTGATVASLMRKGIIDFAPKTGRIGKLQRVGGGW